MFDADYGATDIVGVIVLIAVFLFVLLRVRTNRLERRAQEEMRAMYGQDWG